MDRGRILENETADSALEEYRGLYVSALTISSWAHILLHVASWDITGG